MLDFIIIAICVVLLLLIFLLLRTHATAELIRKLHQDNSEKFLDRLSQNLLAQQKALADYKEAIQLSFSQTREKFDQQQINSLKILQESLQNSLLKYGEIVNTQIGKLIEQTDKRLKEISGQVEKRLSEGFEKTTATFHDVIKRLALIDEAQKKITELSGNVISLQEVLADKKSRGAFGEVQLSGLIRNMLPENCFSLQHTLSNSNRPDCILFLPEPSGNIAIDAKFPLENYRLMIDFSLAESEKNSAEKNFKQNIKKHIDDIASKYIISGETSDGAIMFIPAESIFAEIHGHFPELVDYSQKNSVWMVSPTTMMAILTTARAVLKDEATKKQIHIIQEHLGMLAKDFDRFQVRMTGLAKHIQLAHDDVEQVHKSAQKITSRFNKIEKVELEKISSD